MSEIWHLAGEKWDRLSSTEFEDEAALHDRIFETPEMLPLSGQPRLAAVGSHVQLGNREADIIAVELDGRPVVIEVKLARNNEARRAVVAQALAYAAYLDGLILREFEHDILGSHLAKAGHASLADAMRAADQEGQFEADSFRDALEEHLKAGSFRVVFVLDEAPRELVRLVGYLEKIADRIIVDLVTVHAYEVGGSQILLPQRVDPERLPDESRSPSSRPKPIRSDGSARFREAADHANPDQQAALLKLADWADALAAEGLARVHSVEGVNGDRFTLVPRVAGRDTGIATGWNDNGRASVAVWSRALERLAPDALAKVREAAAPKELGHGSTCDVTDELLEALTVAYRSARGE